MQTDWTKLQSQAIDLLRFPMAVAVVVSHYGKIISPDAAGVMKYLRLLAQLGARWAVPCFFFISGYLFYSQLQTWDWLVWKEKMKRRVRTLFIPYCLWIIIAFFAFYLYGLISSEEGSVSLCSFFMNKGGMHIFWSVNGNIPVGPQSVPLDGPLWFIRDLIYYTVASPLIYFFVTRTKWFGLAALSMAYFMFNPIVPEGIVFFSAGAFFQIENKNILSFAWPYRRYLYVAAILFPLCILLFFHYRRLIEFFFFFTGIGASFCIAAWLDGEKKVRINPLLVRSSFFVFASHEILILYQIAVPIAQKVLPIKGQAGDCLRFFFTPTITVVICLLLLCTLERLLPRVSCILTGDRRLRVLM